LELQVVLKDVKVARSRCAGFANLDTKRVPLPATEEGKSPMRVRIDAAKMFGRLSANGAVDVWNVWIRGNTAVHKDPDAVRDADDTVRATMRVLAELYA
jgi:hypothetical protein